MRIDFLADLIKVYIIKQYACLMDSKFEFGRGRRFGGEPEVGRRRRRRHRLRHHHHHYHDHAKY